MNRKEAAIIIGNIPIDGKDDCYSIAEYQEAKTMAVEALGEPERKTGKWINGYYINGATYKRCNNCFTRIEEIFFANDYDVNYCPSCGYKMEVEE